MKSSLYALPVFVALLSVGFLLAGSGQSQSIATPDFVTAGGFNCSPAPCVLPPTQASEGGGTVTDSPLVTDPSNHRDLLLGSVDFNCNPSAVGFHLSRDGGSTWNRVLCMSFIYTKKFVYVPGDDPLVGYDGRGNAYAAGIYFDNEGGNTGFVAVQKSADGTHWNQPVVALRHPPFDTWLAIDTDPGSPRVNSLYVSGMLSPGHFKSQIWVSHSTDGGATWRQAAVDSVQVDPEVDRFTRMAVGKDGTVYATWLHCRGNKQSNACPTVHFMLSKSTDGGSSWSSPQRIVTAKMPPLWKLPNTKDFARVYNYPVIAVDHSNGPYAGNLYVAIYTWTGTYLRVEVIRSTDGGKTLSKPVALAPKSDTHDQFFPTVSVSPTGLVGVSWLDRRNDPNNHDYQAFAAISTDGGKTFPNTQLTQAFSDPDVNGDGGWIGDYTGNTWAGNKFIAAWMDSSNGVDMQEVVGGVRLK